VQNKICVDGRNRFDAQQRKLVAKMLIQGCITGPLELPARYDMEQSGLMLALQG